MKRFKDYWIPDLEIYNQIQQLKRFVDFWQGWLIQHSARVAPKHRGSNCAQFERIEKRGISPDIFVARNMNS